MDHIGKIFNYCERGGDPSFWAEPVNAWTNLAFIAAGAASLWCARRRPPGGHGLGLNFLIATVFVIGAGSFLFHTLATPRAVLADVVPIGVFMLVYLAYALRQFLCWNVAFTLAGVAAFFGVQQIAEALHCAPGGIGFIAGMPPGQSGACLNGSLGYLPALAVMAAVGAVLAFRRHPAGLWLAAAAGVFAVSLTFRTYDRAWCSLVTIEGRATGTHFLWHLMNALTLFLLLIAAIRHGAYRKTR